MSPIEQVRAELRSALRDAMRARDRAAIAALRGALAALDGAEAVPVDGHEASIGRLEDVARRRLTSADVTRTLSAELDEHLRAAALYRQHGDEGSAAAMQARADAIGPFARLRGPGEDEEGGGGRTQHR